MVEWLTEYGVPVASFVRIDRRGLSLGSERINAHDEAVAPMRCCRRDTTGKTPADYQKYVKPSPQK
jgi:hypothetical protein